MEFSETLKEWEHEVQHGHSALTKLLDEVSAHINVLVDAEDPSYILDDLRGFADELYDDLVQHAGYEENHLFPTLIEETESFTQDLFDRFADEHEQLREHFERVFELLDEAETDDGDLPEISDELCDILDTVKAIYHRHDERERELFDSIVEERVSRDAAD